MHEISKDISWLTSIAPRSYYAKGPLWKSRQGRQSRPAPDTCQRVLSLLVDS
jgi:hypothetical protein